MFSVDNFYDILYQNLLGPLDIDSYKLNESNGSYESLFFYDDIAKNMNVEPYDKLHLFFWDQEPFNRTLFDTALIKQNKLYLRYLKTNALVYSDICSEVSDYAPRYKWYYFFHGIAALDWYRTNFYHVNLKHTKFDKVFITLNRLVTQDRSYRLWLVADLLHHGLNKQGLVSCSLADSYGGSWRDEIFNKKSQLTVDQRKLVYQEFSKLDQNLNLDFQDTPGQASAEMSVVQTDLFQRAFVHVVTETVFYSNKLHLTEKIFRPIVLFRPFILAGCVGNLKYLKQYGFRTFDQWWDESYDLETDNERRLAMITNIVKDLCNKSQQELEVVYEEMRPTLEYNQQHFYGKFGQIVVEEMLDNFKDMIETFNQDQRRTVYNLDKVDFAELKSTWGRHT
jgi:hypothetical protein